MPVGLPARSETDDPTRADTGVTNLPTTGLRSVVPRRNPTWIGAGWCEPSAAHPASPAVKQGASLLTTRRRPRQVGAVGPKRANRSCSAWPHDTGCSISSVTYPLAHYRSSGGFPKRQGKRTGCAVPDLCSNAGWGKNTKLP